MHSINLDNLPEKAKKELLDFYKSLLKKYKKEATKRNQKKKVPKTSHQENLPFFGVLESKNPKPIIDMATDKGIFYE